MFRINIEAKTIEKSRLREKIENVPLLLTGRTFPVNKPEPFQKLPKRSENSPLYVCVVGCIVFVVMVVISWSATR
jgi:hypothetical protein